MLMPIMMGYTPEKSIAPVADKDCSIATVAEELCTITVSTKPARIPKIGVSEKLASTSINAGEFAKPFTAPVIFIRPMNRIPKPIEMSPMVLAFLVLINMMSTMPRNSAIGANVSVSKNHSSQLPPPSIKARLVIQAVTVVPIFAPITIATACFSVNTPAPISATARTIVAVEL